MQKYLKLHYDNNNRIEHFSTSSNYAFINIVLKTNKKGKKLKNVLLEIIKNFESLISKIKKTLTCQLC